MAEKLKPRQIWGSGRPLQNAWQFYASPSEKEAFLQDTKPIQPVLPGGLQPSNWGEGILLGVAAVGQVWKAHRDEAERKAELEDDLKDQLLDRLSDGDLVAFGYRRRPTRASRTPQKINANFFFDAIVDWEHGSAINRDEEYLSIHVLIASVLPPKLEKKTGRPRADSRILEALELADARKSDFRAITPGRALLRVQAILHELDSTYPANKRNREDATIAKRIALFREVKKI